MQAIRFVILCVAAMALPACSRTPNANAPSASTSAGELRIVSLSPAISRTLVDFHLENSIVGRTPFCASLDQSIPVVGSLLDVDYERLIKLKPTHVLVQPSLAQGVDPKLRELAKTNGWVIGEFPSLNTVDDVEAMILKLPDILFADGTPKREEAAARAADLVAQIARALTPEDGSAWHGSTLLVASVNPVLVFGSETYLDDILTALGGTNAALGAGWMELSLEDIVHLDPEAMIIVREKPVEKGGAMEAAGPLATLPIRAVQAGRVAVLVNPGVNLPSSGVIGVASALRDVLESLAQAQPAEASP